MTPRELAELYLDQQRAYRDGVPPSRTDPNALYVWEDLICNAPDDALPVFEEILARISDDETLEQVWYRLRLLLYRHYERAHEAAADLLKRYKRFALIAGPRALDALIYAKRELDREALINAYRVIHRTHDFAGKVERLARSDPHRALTVATEIIHRGMTRGRGSFDVMSPMADVISAGGEKVIEEIERLATQSVAVRRVLWRLKRQLRPSAEGHRAVSSEVWDRMEKAAGDTTDYTNLDQAIPAPERQLDADEAIIEGWFAHDENFWAFSALDDLCGDDPMLAWSITLDLIARADDDLELAAIAAGPLEDLIRKHSDAIWNDLIAKAHGDARFRTALHGVWVFPDDGEVFRRFTELMQLVDAEPS